MKDLKIFFLHGFMGSPTESSFLSKLSHFNVEILAPKLKNLNNDGELLKLRDEFLKFNPDLIYGYSMGGRLALDLIVKASPSNLKYVVLESAALNNLTSVEAKRRIELDQLRAKEIVENYEGFLDKWYQLPLWGELSKEERSRLCHLRLSENGDYTRELSEQIKYMSPAHFILPAKEDWPVHLQYLYICGLKDRKYSDMIQQFRPGKLSFSTEKCPNVGHSIHLQDPDFIIKAISKWPSP